MIEEKKYKLQGVAGTVVFHAVILALLLIFGFTTPLPLPGEEGVEVSLGNSDMGLGDFQPEKPAVVKASTPPREEVEKVDQEIVTQDTEEAPAVETGEEEPVPDKPAEKVEKPEPVKEEPVVDPRALYKGKSDESAENTSEGIAGGQGDQGAPGGSVDPKQYLGKGGFGEGTKWSLEGRRPMKLPKPANTFSENATVVVQITVDKYGKVVKAIALDKGSNTTNSRLRRLAEEAARKAKFNPKMDAAEMQRGTITYHFIIKN